MADGFLKAKTIAPGLTVNDADCSLKFYTEGLGFTIEERNEENGKLRYAMLAAGDAQLGIGQDDFAKGRDRKKGVGMRLWISTSLDIAMLADRAKAAGITLDSEAAPLPWGPMAFEVTDPDGFVITISNHRS